MFPRTLPNLSQKEPENKNLGITDAATALKEEIDE
jgi:hypothetical protein